MQAFVPKNRRPKFELFFRIGDLNNVPLVSGTSSIKWHLDASKSAEHNGRTPKYLIKDHKVIYDYEKTIELRLIIGKDSVLQESHLQFEVQQDYQTSGRSERITLGMIKLNLAEYVDAGVSDQSPGGSITRRYLMQDSKINSTLKIEVAMKHLEGDRNYTAPPLRSAPVFGGIAGIISADVSEAIEEGTNMPSLSSKSREHGELQDMYRRTLAASWAAGSGEPRADECIEDIFSGGDGWGERGGIAAGSQAATPIQSRLHLPARLDDDSDDNSHLSRPNSNSNLSAAYNARRNKWGSPGKRAGGRQAAQSHHHDLRESLSAANMHGSAVSGRSSIEQSFRKMERHGLTTGGRRGKGDHFIDEFSNPYKEDLSNWRVRV